MSQKLDEIEFTILDTETTGLEPESGDRIIELACVRLKAGQPKDEFQALINPGRAISEEALAVHHISEEMLKGAPTMERVIPDFLEFTKDSVLCAYNATFDIGFIKKELELLKREMPQDTHIIDILTMARKLLPNFNRYTLSYVAQVLGIKQLQQHRALSDVHTTVGVFNELIKRYR